MNYPGYGKQRPRRLRRFMRGLLEFLQFLSVVVGCLALLAGFVVAFMIGVNHSDHVSCLRLHENTGLETRYARSGLNGECYIKVGDQWVPEERWIQMEGS